MITVVLSAFLIAGAMPRAEVALTGDHQCQGRSLTVILADVQTGKPVVGKWVRVEGWTNGDDRRIRLRAKTDRAGRAVFCIREPLPELVMVGLEAGSPQQCGGFVLRTEEVLRSGAIGPIKSRFCGGSPMPVRFTPHPGEVVVFAKYLSLRERLEEGLRP